MSASDANRMLLKKLVVVAVGMFGFGFALVPLYEKICQVTGINNIERPARSANTQVDESRWLTVELDSNVRGNVPWEFKPGQRLVKVHPGQLVQVEYELKNPTEVAATGQAIPSYGPQLAGQYFRKLECFCFSQQELQAGEARRMPVVFVIDPGLPKDVNTVTLSYTLFEVEGGAKRAAGGAPRPQG